MYHVISYSEVSCRDYLVASDKRVRLQCDGRWWVTEAVSLLAINAIVCSCIWTLVKRPSKKNRTRGKVCGIDPFGISGCRKSQQGKKFRKIFRPPFWRPTFFSVPWYCCAVGCRNRQGKSAERFYRFPTEVQKREAWIAAIKRKNWVPTEYSRVYAVRTLLE